jgi:hypothetical protein
LLERPTSSSSAFLLHFASTSLIIFSAIVTILETVPSFHSISPRVWFGVEKSLVLLFTVEYCARSVAWSYSWISLAKWLSCACSVPSSDFPSHVDLVSSFLWANWHAGYITILHWDNASTRYRAQLVPCKLAKLTFDSLSCSASPFFECFDYCGFSDRSDTTARYFCKHVYVSLKLYLSAIIFRTIEVMYLAIRRSHHALLALSFFIAMVLTVFSTLLCVTY